MSRKNKVIVSIVGITIVLLALLGITYAYYLTRIQGNTNTNSISVTTADLKVVYRDGNTNILTSDKPILPGEFSSSKDFTVTNSGNQNTNYAVVLKDFSVTYASDTTINGITHEEGDIRKMEYPDDMIMEITCIIESTDNSRNGKSCGIINGSLPRENSILTQSNIEIGDTHKYIVTLTYIDSGIDQSLDMNKTINGKIDIIDPKGTIDLNGKVANYQNGDYVEINSTPIKSEIIDGNYKIVGVEPGNHTLNIKYVDGDGEIKVRGSQPLIIKKGTEANIDGNTITFTDVSRTVNVDITSNYSVTMSGTIKSSFKDVIIANAKSSKNGTYFVDSDLNENDFKTNVIESTIRENSTNNIWDGQYITYADSYTVDENNGFTLTGLHTCKYNECKDYIANKYLASDEMWLNGATTNVTISRVTGLPKIFKVTEVNGTDIMLQKLIIPYTGNSLTATEDDYGTSYYFRGNVIDNFVNFAGMCWKIIRIVGDGSVKLILEDQYTTCDDNSYTDGTEYVYTGNWDVGWAPFGYIYHNCDDENGNCYNTPEFINYEGGLADILENFQTSKLNNVLNKLKYGDWCYDDTMYEDIEGTKPILDPIDFYNNNKTFYYGSSIQKEFPLKCNGTKLYEFRTGNKMYVGAITADEARIALATSPIGYIYNGDYVYLINDYHYQYDSIFAFSTMSPADFYGTYANFYSVLGWGNLISSLVIGDPGNARPVISLKNIIQITSGDGTQTNPYVIE